MKYIIISPVRNEGQYLERTAAAITAQEWLPAQWIIVNDGSTDNTGPLADQLAQQHAWITVLHRTDRGFRQAGGGVIEAYDEGFAAIEVADWEFVVKLDGDLHFAPDYFRRCLEKFAGEERLGIGGGVICIENEGGQWEVEAKNEPVFHVRGATKIYRRGCWEDIGGLLQAPGWDTLDEVKANMLHWETRRFDDVQLLHLRVSGRANGMWQNWVKNGRANYIAGYHPLFMLLKCVKRAFRIQPWFVESLGLFWGYFTSPLKGVRQVPDRQLIKYIREQQLNRLLMRESIWKY